MASPYFISEVSSNHGQDIARSIDFIKKSAEIGCDAVKFQLFKLDELFAPEILARSEEHRRRRAWELPTEFLPELKAACTESKIDFSCTPFYLEAVEELFPYVDFYKIASYEMIWNDLIKLCAETGKPLYLSTGMATLEEVTHAVDVFQKAGGTALTLFHCVSGYPTPLKDCNLKAIETLAQATNCAVGWSDHSRNPSVVTRAIETYGAPAIEFHLDLEGDGAEYQTGHCWLPHEIAPVIAGTKALSLIDGDGVKAPTPAEIEDRPWRADPSDGRRPTLEIRDQWRQKPLP